MARTVIGLGDAKAVKKYSAFLAVDVPRVSYFGRKFMGEGEDSGMPIQRLTHLENDAGELITYDLSLQLTMQPVEGDDYLEGKEDKLKFYTDQVYIDQMRGGVNSGGKMTRKRTLHDLRKIARKRQTEWWARVFDELFFMYLSGSRGSNTGFLFPTTYTSGFAGNSFSTPDTAHNLQAATATTAGTINVADYMTVASIEQAAAVASMMGGETAEVPMIQPVKIEGEDHMVCIMNGWQEYAMRTATTTGGWLDIQKALATMDGAAKSPICKGGLGMIAGVVLHKSKGILQVTTGAAGTYIGTATSTSGWSIARALVLGQQAAVCAFGSPGTGLRFDWHEETRDNGNEVIISSSSIFGVKKTTFNGVDFGVIALDTAAYVLKSGI